MTTLKNIEPSESLHARVPGRVLEDIDYLASNMGRSRNWVFNEALKQYVEIQQWQVDLIKDRLRQSKSPHAKFIPHTTMMKRQEKRLKKKLDL